MKNSLKQSAPRIFTQSARKLLHMNSGPIRTKNSDGNYFKLKKMQFLWAIENSSFFANYTFASNCHIQSYFYEILQYTNTTQNVQHI